MRKVCFSILFLFIFIASYSQQYLNQPSLSERPGSKKVTFWDIERAFNEQWEGKKRGEKESENAKEGGWEQFKRWEWFAKQRTYPSGVFPHPEILFEEHVKLKSAAANKKGMSTAAANWTFKGPKMVPTGGSGAGAGRLNCITFHPTNPNIIYVGAACGGLWKTTDGGATWSTNTDLLPSLSISDIAINPSNPQEMYVATGDKYGIYFMWQTWGHYSAGVLKSTDGGATWNSTGLTYAMSNGALIHRLIINPTNPGILLAATKTGVFRTSDGGTTWTNVKTGKFYDIELNPGNPNIGYAADSLMIYRSTDGGANWSAIGINPSGRSSITVSTGFPNTVYIYTQSSLYYSGDGGVNFSLRTSPYSLCGAYGYYDMVIAVSPADEDVLVAGGLKIVLSTDGGNNWALVSDDMGTPGGNMVHADQHELEFLPGSSTTIFSGNDGGFYKTTNQGTNWSDLSAGLDIKQYYRMASSFLTPTLMFAGSQDCGTDKITGATAVMCYGFDGEECLVDYTNDNIVFVSTQGGAFKRSTNGGLGFSNISTSGCDWTSPLAMDPNNHNIVYLGGSAVFKSTNNGVNYTYTGFLDGSCVYSIEVAPSNSNYIYAASFGHIFRSVNAAGAWTDITGTLPVSSAAITGIAISSTNPDVVWVNFSGFAAGTKVFKTTDGGTTWTNVSGTLPNVPANCIEYQAGSNDVVYLGTDLGVFYRDASMSDWASYNSGLPNVIVNELEVYTPTAKLRAATYGRGIWESDLQTAGPPALDAGTVSLVSPAPFSCDSVVAPKVRIINTGTLTITSIDIKYKIGNQSIQTYNYIGSLTTNSTADITLPTYTLTSGTHTLTAYTTNPNSSVDQNNLNDTLVSTFTITPTPPNIQTQVQEGFVSVSFPPANWALENSSGIWSRSATVGGFGLSTQSARADFYNTANGTDILTSPHVDFQNLVPPIRLFFDVAHNQYNSSRFDSLFVEMYDECNASGKVVYKKGGASLATSPASTASFVPTSSQWRTDTVNLDTMAGKQPLQVRFLAKSNNGNYLYLDNINITTAVGGVSSLQDPAKQLFVYPNPTAGRLEVICSAKGPLSAELYDLLGEKVLSFPASASGFHLDMPPLKAGIYLLKISGTDFVRTERVILQK